MDSGGRVLTCASHDIIVASPQRNTMHEACWRPSLGQTLNGFFFFLILFNHFYLARVDH